MLCEGYFIIGREECSRFMCLETAFWAVFFERARLYPFISDERVFFNLRKGGRVLTCQEKTAWAMEQLCAKEKELGRLPKKEDFDDKTRSRIKAFLGPWPRALEKAGLKPVKKQ